VLDLLYVLGSIALFYLMVAFVAGCDRLLDVSDQEREAL
jgi:hypothetical protein